MKKTIFALLAGVLAMGVAQAQTLTTDATDTAPHAYVGVGVGVDKNSLTNDYKRSTRIFGGYEFDQDWGVEAGYTYQGKSGFYEPLGNDFNYVHLKSSSFYVAAKYKYGLTERTALYGKLGLSHGEYKFSSQAPGWNFKDSNNGLYAALGVESKLTERVSVYAEYEHNGESARNGPENRIFGAGLKFGF